MSKRKNFKSSFTWNAQAFSSGCFAISSPCRPNPIGLTLVRLLKVEGNILTVKGLDAFDMTPVLDVKPFGRRTFSEEVRVPEWWKKLKRRG